MRTPTRACAFRFIAVLFSVCIAFALSTAAFGGPITDVVKWSQLPDLEQGIDILSTHDLGVLVADDWQCESPLPVTDVHWWGSYVENNTEPPVGFLIRFYSDLAGAEPSQPAVVLHEEFFFYPEVHEEFYGVQQYTGHDAYQYFVYLDEPFEQQQGQIYWLSIQAVSSPLWGWKTSSDHWRDAAVWGVDPYGTTWDKLVYPLNHPLVGQNIDMAFELTEVSEPSALTLLAGGFGLLLFFRRRR